MSLSQTDIHLLETHPWPLPKDQSLAYSICIQLAHEKERPLSIVYQLNHRSLHFCGYIEQIDPEERWIRLRNGTLQQAISIPTILTIDIC